MSLPKRLKAGKGFTLIEILIVMTILGLLASLLFPNLLRARINANESAAISNLRTLGSALEVFRGNQNPPAYPAALTDLSNVNPVYAAAELTDGRHQGYAFRYNRADANRYTLNADPTDPGFSGIRGFFVDGTGVIRAANPAPADANSPVVE